MISVRDGQNQILAQISAPAPPELLAVTRARERVLADDLRAPFDVPPTDNSAVDGYAVASGDVPASGTRVERQPRPAATESAPPPLPAAAPTGLGAP